MWSKPKSCNDNDCDQKYNCHRWNGEGELVHIRHGVDPEGMSYCNYILNDEGLEQFYNKLKTMKK